MANETKTFERDQKSGLPQEVIEALETGDDEIFLQMADLDPELCPPDYRYDCGDKEAWVYIHGNIAELLFVKSQ